MKTFTTIVGILLILYGIAVLGYQGFSYTQQEKVAQIGGIEVTANTQKTIKFPPIVGGASILAGLVLVVIGRNGKRK